MSENLFGLRWSRQFACPKPFRTSREFGPRDGLEIPRLLSLRVTARGKRTVAQTKEIGWSVKELVEIRALLTSLLFDAGILRRFLRRVSLAKPTFASLQC